MTRPIKVTSHVGRDFLQNAQFFGTLPKVVWEYVSNALDNPGERESVQVDVTISRQHIIIEDDACGMSREDLARFFQMHGENLQRRLGKKVRGRFGTGKSAAFGIASKLRIETVRFGLLNIVELERKDIARSKGSAIPVKDVVVDAPTTGENGTRVIITGIHARQMDVKGTIAYLQRHLGRRQQRHTVIVNGHILQVQEPPSVRTCEFQAPPEVARQIGDVTLTLKLSPTPLEPENAGVDVYSYGNWHDTTLAGLPVTDLTRRVFGEVDVPALEDYEGPFPPFDSTRNNTLSPQSPPVQTLFVWLAVCIGETLRELETEEYERRRTVEAKVLRVEAAKIQRLLNDDFRELQLELQRGRNSLPVGDASVPTVATGAPNPDSPYILPDAGGVIPIDLVAEALERPSTPPEGEFPSEPNGQGDGYEPSDGWEGLGMGMLPGEGRGAPRELVERKSRSGGFTLEYTHESGSAPRSRYDADSKTIFINLDHPQLRSALKLGGLDSPGFRQMCYELAFVEYSMALCTERAGRDTSFTGEEALYDIRDTVDRVARRLAEIF